MKNQLDIALLDASKKAFPTRFYNDYFVNEFGRLEALISARYGRFFSVLLIYLDDFTELDKQLGRQRMVDLLKRVIKAVIEVVRNCDVVGMVQNRGLIVILPETDYIGSLITVRKLRKAIDALNLHDEASLSVAFSQASFPRDADNYGELVTIAEKRLNDYRGGVYGKIDLEAKLFWENVTTLLNEDFESSQVERFDIGENLELPDSFRGVVAGLVMEEVGRTPQKKGILYLSPGKFSQDMTAKRAVETLGETNTKVFILGGKGMEELASTHVIPINLTDSRFQDTFFLFLLRDDIAYAFIAREAWGGIASCVHMTEPFIITCLIEKLQRDYSLQEQL